VGALIVAAAALAVATPSAAALAPPEPCDLMTCVARAVERGPQVRSAESEVEAQAIARDRAAAQAGPRVLVDGSLQVWNKALVSSFGNIPDLPFELPDTSFTVRPQVTWNLSLTVAQPLTRLWTIFEARDIAALGVDIAELELGVTRRRTALEAVRAYLGVGLARELVVITEASLAARAADVERVDALVEAGLVDESQALRAALGVADARQGLAEARGQLAVARSQLAAMVGAPVEPAEDALGHGPLPALDALDALDGARERALAERLEVRTLAKRLGQASGRVTVARSELLPAVDLIASAQLANASEFQDTASLFVGLRLTWVAWDWMASWRGVDEARARSRSASYQMERLTDGIRLEVEAAFAGAEAALERFRVADAAVALAEESYRVVRERQSARAATAFDVLEAETTLTRTRTEARAARARFLLARAELTWAMGGDPAAIAAGGAW